MHSSAKDPTNSVGAWFAACTYPATRPQDWTPVANLFLDYRRHAAASGIRMRDQLGVRAFEVELVALCRRQPQKRPASRFPGGKAQLVDFLPRVIRAPRQLAA